MQRRLSVPCEKGALNTNLCGWLVQSTGFDKGRMDG